MERLSFGHGFIPRIGKQNYKALERALSPPSLFGDEPSDVPLVIVDGAWANPEMSFISLLRALGVGIVVDTQIWRLADERTQEVAKYQRLGHRPTGLLSLTKPDEYLAFVNADVEWQLKVGAGSVMLPSLMPVRDDDSSCRSLTLAIEAALHNESVAGRPLIGFLGVHSQSLEVTELLAEDPLLSMLSALYIQVTPVDPMLDSVSKLVQLANLMRRFEDAGVPVIAGHLGGFGGVLRALGVSAADAGLGSGETFDAGRLLRSGVKRSDGSKQGGGASARRYLPQLMRSVSPEQWKALMSINSLRGYLDCRLKCCRNRTIDDRTEWGREHSLRTRVTEAASLSAQPLSMRAGIQLDVLSAARTSLVTVNSALQGNNLLPLPTEHVENQIAALGRLMSTRGQ